MRGRHTNDMNAVMMESTVRLSSPDETVVGTGFILGKPLKNNPAAGRFVLITAAHVFSGMRGETAILMLRKRTAGGDWEPVIANLQIRNGDKPLWVQHPTEDICAIFIALPPEITATENLLSTRELADDEMIERSELHPGDSLYILGFPFGTAANDLWFPILRSGKFASYPVTPSRQLKTFLIDFQVFPGNSGGPVYFAEAPRYYPSKGLVIERVFFVLGLVIEQRDVIETVKEFSGSRTVHHSLWLAVVAYASLIRETIDLLPISAEEAPH